MASEAKDAPLSVGPQSEETYAEKTIELMSVRQLMWLRFKRSKPAVASAIFLALMYLVAILAGFLAPYGVRQTHDKYPAAAPHVIHIRDTEGNFHWPFVYELVRKVDPETFRATYSPNLEVRYPIRYFQKGEPYTILGLIRSDVHLFLPAEGGVVFLLGTDRQGRDLLSRILYGSQISLTVGLVGIAISLVIGSFVGTMSGFYGGTFDVITQRVVEVLLAFPQIPLWLALAAAVPANWSSIKVYFGITIVLSIVSWAGLSRQVRAKALSVRELDFVMAARLAGSSDLRIITRHIFPSILSHVLVVATLSIPGMILGETALSYLGLGIRPPMTSWGVLLSETQYTRVLTQQPWLITPVAFVMATVIAFNFVGDGLRDAADPFAR